MILFDREVPIHKKWIPMRIFRRLRMKSCKSSSNKLKYTGFSFDIGDFNNVIHSEIAHKKVEVSTQTCEADFFESARAWSPSMIRRQH